MASTTIRKNAFKKIEGLLRSAALIRVIRIDDMGDEYSSVSAEQVLEAGRKYEFDRVYESGDTLTCVIHANWFFVAYKTVDGARRTLTAQAFEKYFGEGATR